jgi:hypothetical protein
MRPNVLVAISLAIAGASSSAAAEPLDIKPGRWQVAIKVEDPGKSQAQGPRESLDTTCVTKEDLASKPFGSDEDEGCKVTVLAQTRARWQGRLDCPGPTPRIMETKIEALSRESMRAESTVKVTMPDGKVVNRKITMTGKWLGSTCAKDD